MACLVFRLCENSPGIVRDVFLDMGWTEYEDDDDNHDWNIWWRSSGFRTSDFEACRPWQRLNHFPKSTAITRKDCLVRNLRRMKGTYGKSMYSFVPLSLNLPNDYKKFVSEYSKQKETGKKCLWICKPADQSRGKGIFIFKDLNELTYDCASVVQKYIRNPMLIAGYKFDLRIYVLMTSFCPLHVYAYHEGLVRFGTKKFDLNNLDNVYSHLTNTSINKQSPWYATDKDRIGSGCKWSIGQLRTYFHQNNINDRLLWHKVSAIIILTLLAQPPEVQENSSNCFELFGFDILIDENLKPWLLEVNFSPSLGIESALDLAIKRPLVQDTLDIINLKDSDITAFNNLTMNGNHKKIKKHNSRSQATAKPHTVESRNITIQPSISRASAPPRYEQRKLIPRSQKYNNLNSDGKNSIITSNYEQSGTERNKNCDTKPGQGYTLSKEENTALEGDTNSHIITMEVTEQSTQDFSAEAKHLIIDNANQMCTESSPLLRTASLEFQEAFYWTKLVPDSSNSSNTFGTSTLKDTKDIAFSERFYQEQGNNSFGQLESSVVVEDESEEKHLLNDPNFKKKGTANLCSVSQSLPSLMKKALVKENYMSMRRSSKTSSLTYDKTHHMPKTNTKKMSLVTWSDRYRNPKTACSKMKLCSRVGDYVLCFPFNDATQKCCFSKQFHSKIVVDEVKKALYKATEVAKARPTTSVSNGEKPLDLNKPYWGFSSLFEYSVGIS